MADIQGQRITELTQSSSPVAGDKILMDSAASGARGIDYDKLADAILNRLTSKTYSLDAGTKTLIAALNDLNSNLAGLKIIPKTLTVGGSVTFTSETLSQYLVLVIGASGQRCAFIIRGASSTGYNVLSDTNSMTQLSVSVNGRSFTITSASTAGSDAAVIALVFSGTVS